MNFKWNGSGPYLSYREWNPVREPLLLTELVSPETNGTNYLEVLDVRSGTKLLSIREVPEAASTWSRDGKNLLLYEKEGLTTVPVPNP